MDTTKRTQSPLFRDESGAVLSAFNNDQALNFLSSPFDIYIMLSRYKFAMRHIKTSHSVADVGIGQGLGSALLASVSKTVTCLDYDQALLDSCQSQLSAINNVDFRHYDLLNPDQTLDAKFDVVVSNDVIEHFNYDDIDKVVKSYKRLLTKSGFAIIGTPNKESQKHASDRRKNTHLYEFGCEEFRHSLEKHFRHVFIFGMNDEIVSTQFLPMSWYFLAICCN